MCTIQPNKPNKPHVQPYTTLYSTLCFILHLTLYPIFFTLIMNDSLNLTLFPALSVHSFSYYLKNALKKKRRSKSLALPRECLICLYSICVLSFYLIRYCSKSYSYPHRISTYPHSIL